MDDLLALRASTVFLRREALAAGYSDTQLRHARRDGAIQRIRHGAYVSSHAWAGASAEERHLIHADAVLLSHKTPLALSHVSAALAHGFQTYQQDLSKVHVLCLDNSVGRTHADVVYHQSAANRAEDMVKVSNRLVVPATRAALEAAHLTDVRRALVVLDSALHQGATTTDQIIAEYTRTEGNPRTQSLRVAVGLARAGSESVGESLGRYLMWRHHIPEPELQKKVRDQQGELVAQLDWTWAELGLCGEFDGREKYTRYLRPGESVVDVVMREKSREDKVRELTGFKMIRLVWDDLDPRNAERTAARIRRNFRSPGALAS